MNALQSLDVTAAASRGFEAGAGVRARIIEGRSPVTIWLHHGVGSARSWDSFVPEAADGRGAVVYDRRGFGAAPRRGDPGVDLFDEGCHDLVELIERLGRGPVHLIGHSDGATVALLCAARRPQLVSSLAVVAAHVRADPVTIGTLERMGPPELWPEGLRKSLRRAHGDDWHEVAASWHRLWTSTQWRDWSIVEELSAVRCPVLVVHDRRDLLSPALHAEALRTAIPWATMLWSDAGSHDPHRSIRTAFVSALSTLWRQAEGVAGAATSREARLWTRP